MLIEGTSIGVVDCARCKKPVRKYLTRFEMKMGPTGSLVILGRCHGTAEQVLIDAEALGAELISGMRNVIDVTMFCDRPTFEVRANRSFQEGP